MQKLDIKSIYEWPFTLQILVILPLCALIFYLAYIFDYVSLNRTFADSKRQEIDLKQQLDMIISQQIKLENDLSQLSMLEKMIGEWQKKLVLPAKIPDLLNEILKIGTGNGLHFDQLSPGVETKDSIYSKVPIKIVAEGGYHQIANFISQIASMHLLVVVRGLSLTKPITEDNKDKTITEQLSLATPLNIEMILEVYYLSGDK